MLAAKTIQRYLDQCNKVLKEKSYKSAKSLVIEIVSVFQTDIEGISYNIDAFFPGLEEKDIDYISDLKLLRARLQKEFDALESIDNEETKNAEKIIFISHSTKDKDYVGAIVNLLESIGLHEDEIICSSIPPYCIPLDNNVYNWLVNKFQNSTLHMLFVLSKPYYSSAACLNEMGAAWATKHKWTAMLLPGFEFREISGCIDPMQISIKLDDEDKDTLTHRLNELKDNLTKEFNLRPISSSLWEKNVMNS